MPFLLRTIVSRDSLLAGVLISLSFVCNGLTPVVVGQAIDHAIAERSGIARWLGLLGRSLRLTRYAVPPGVGWACARCSARITNYA